MLDIFKDRITKIIQCKKTNHNNNNEQKCCNFLNLKK